MTMQQHKEPNTVKSNISKPSAKENTSKTKTIEATIATTVTVGSLAGASPTRPLIAPYKKDTRKIFVGGLGKTVNNQNFKECFKRFGEVIDSVVMIDRATNRHRGFGFVTFQDPTVANTVLSKGNEGKPIPEGGWKQGQLAIFGKMCEVKASEPKKGDANAGESGGNGLNVSSKSSSSSDTSAGMIPSNIQFHAGYQNTHDPQYGAWSGPAISPLPPNSAVYPPVVLGPVPASSQLQGYNELNMGHVNPIHYYGNPYDGGIYETYPVAYAQYVYNPYMHPSHGPIYAPQANYYPLPPEGASMYGSYYSYPTMPQQYPVVPGGMTLPAEGNPQAAAPSFAQEGKQEKAEK